MNVIGVGKTGCAIAKELSEYPQYNVYYVDAQNQKKYENFSKVKEQDSHEAYENNYRKIVFKNLPVSPTIVIFSGAGKIAGLVLRLLEQLKEHDLTVLYIKPDISLLSEDSVVRERIVSGILQQYARSSLLKNMCIVSNEQVERVLENVSIADYWRDINATIASTFHMLNVFDNTEPLLSTMSSPKETSKISTMGVVSYKSLDEKIFYELQKPRLKKYFFGISEKTLEREKDLLNKIRSYVKSKSEEKCVACFAIYSTDYDQDYVYVSQYASFIQEEH
tara:strand:+ start:1924 stop:2757 length:834 start_codon:yes stop_codon:yes gene_type:complete